MRVHLISLPEAMLDAWSDILWLVCQTVGLTWYLVLYHCLKCTQICNLLQNLDFLSSGCVALL